MNKKLNLEWVADNIGDDYKNWKKGDVVKIQAQTGTGKTYFITGDKGIKGLVDRLNCFEKMIYICNRTELKRQIKLELLKKYKLEIPYKIVNGKNVLDVDALDEKSNIENVVITSYHAISFGKLDNIYCDKENSLDNFDYIICDECHFFMTDSSFNNKSYLALEELINTRHVNAIKIFISATLYEVEKIIEAQADKHKAVGFGKYSNFKVHNYTTGTDYNYLDVKYFKSIKDMIQLIKNDKTEEKWMIFVTSMSKGEYIEKELKEDKISATFIHANIGENDEKKKISIDCKFKSKVLISTKCLDNGINIKDEDVKKMVVMAYDKTTFIQEVGRIRFNINDAPIINLYIPMLNKKTFTGKINENYQPKIDNIMLFENDINKFRKKFNNDLDKAPKDIFYLDNKNEWKVNLLGMAKVYKDKSTAIDIIKRFEDKDKFAFIKEQLNWLDLLDTFDEDKLIVDVADIKVVKNLEDYLKHNIGRLFFKNDKDELINTINLIDSRGRKQKTPSLLKEYLESNFNLTLKYDCETSRIINGEKKKFKNCWKIREIVG